MGAPEEMGGGVKSLCLSHHVQPLVLSLLSLSLLLLPPEESPAPSVSPAGPQTLGKEMDNQSRVRALLLLMQSLGSAAAIV